MSFGDRLRFLRKKERITQQELGNAVHVSKVSISGYENGNRFPDTSTLQLLADFFEVTTDYLLDRQPLVDPVHDTFPLDVGIELEKILRVIEHRSEIVFHGNTLDSEKKELLLRSLEAQFALIQKLQNQYEI